jgi:hypothetical protein
MRARSRSTAPATRHATAAFVAALVLSACGTTVPGAMSGNTSTDGLGLGPSTGAAGSDGQLSGSLPGGEERGPESPTLSDAPSTSGTGSLAGSGSRPGAVADGPRARLAPGSYASIPVSGRGWDAKNVYLGILTQKDTQTVLKTAGVDVNIGDTEGQGQAMAAYLNAQGGLFGRKVVMRYYDQSTLAVAGNPDGVGATTCTHYAQDAPVIALYSFLGGLDVPSFRACLAKAKIPLLNASATGVDEATGRALRPYFYQTSMVAWDQLAPVLVSRLKAQGYFAGWDVRLQKTTSARPKIGILVLDDPAGARIGKIVQKALARAGQTDVLTYAYPYPGNDIGPAVLNFSGNGVTHVISTDIELSAFQTHAQSQQYFPRYGISTYNSPYTNLKTIAPAQQQIGDVGVGWAPSFDVYDTEDPGRPSAGDTRCMKLMAAGGQGLSGQRAARALAESMCDSLFLITTGAVAGGGLDATQILAGAVKLAPTFSSAVSSGTSGLAVNKLFVAGGSRDLAWYVDCQCFKYSSPAITSF